MIMCLPGAEACSFWDRLIGKCRCENPQPVKLDPPIMVFDMAQSRISETRSNLQIAMRERGGATPVTVMLHDLEALLARLERAEAQEAERDRLRSEIAAREAAAAAAMRWRPIETAPRDGSMVDLWFVPYHGHARRLTDMWWVAELGWRNGDKSVVVRLSELRGVTHWQPVPNAPPPVAVERAAQEDTR